MNQYDPNQLPPHLRDDNVPSSAAYQPKKSHKLRTGLIVAGVLIAGLVGCTAIVGKALDTEAPVSVTAPATTEPAVTGKPTKATPKMTASQEQAVRSARSYLEMSAFSRKGLIRQLSSDAGDGFSVKDATFAVNYLKVNWNEQAAKAAKNYLSMTHFSRAGLIRQLESSAGDGFTHSQAVYGVKKAGL